MPRVSDHLDRFILLPDAARQLNLSEVKLRTLIKNGKIRAAILPSGEIGVSEQDAQAQKPTPKEELPEYKKHAHLKGQAIWISQAARDYKIPHKTIARWANSGIIRTLGMDGNKILLDEADVAYCAEIYHDRGGQGKWLFNDDGTPYQKSTLTNKR